MFPVPQHLLQGRAGEGLGSDSGPATSGSAGQAGADPVLKVLQPLLSEGGPSRHTAQRIGQLRGQLETAVRDNKARAHTLLIDNYPSVSSHIRLGAELQTNSEELQLRLAQLERQIDPSDAKTSFLPPVVSLLNKHFSASSSRTSARAHVRALKALRSRTAGLKKLEEAVWSGRSADEWVVGELQRHDEGYDMDAGGEEVLKGTKVASGMEAKAETLRSFAVGQITEGFHRAISFAASTSSQHGVGLSIQSETALQPPRINRPAHVHSAAVSHHIYPLAEIYTALSRLNLLQPLLQTTQNRILREIVHPILTGRWRVEASSTDTLAIIRLQSAPEQSATEILKHAETVLNFLSYTVFPLTETPPPERRFFFSELDRAVFQAVLDNLILPSLPSSLAGIPEWLVTLERAVEVEKNFSPPAKPIIRGFFHSQAGNAWATQKRYAVADTVRRLIMGGWEGWESEQKERERTVLTIVEVEVEAEDEDEPMGSEEKDESFGWGFEDDAKSPPTRAPAAELPPDEPMQTETEDDGWGLDESFTPTAGPSQNPLTLAIRASSPPAAVIVNGGEEEDGWDLDPSPASSAPVAAPVAVSPSKPTSAIIKPAREAKRLGKKVAKKRATEDEYDPWASGSESVASSSVKPSISRGSSPSPIATPIQVAPPTPSVQVDDWAAWDEPRNSIKTAGMTSHTSQKKAKGKRKELREESRTLKERYLVSVACERLMETAKSVLQEIEELQATSLSSPSFSDATSTPILLESILDVFALYRALLPAHFSTQLRDVPAISFQAYNDAVYLSTLVLSLAVPSPLTDEHALSGEADRLLALAEHLFDAQLDAQRASITEALDELDNFEDTADEKVFRRAERGIRGIVHDIESLARVLKPVLPRSTHTEILGELASTLIARMTDQILALEDITEVESNRLTELLKAVQTLEGLFVGVSADVEQDDTASGGAQNVKGWLKFCYVSEILQANLVDITYLLDQGALIDFTSVELANLVRALFASSEKRDAVVQRIEREGTGGQGVAGISTN